MSEKLKIGDIVVAFVYRGIREQHAEVVSIRNELITYQWRDATGKLHSVEQEESRVLLPGSAGAEKMQWPTQSTG